jgi:aldose sugar dehydrogenase
MRRSRAGWRVGEEAGRSGSGARGSTLSRVKAARWGWSLAAVASVFALPAMAEPKGRDAGQLYGQLCANCHGQNMEGGKGGSLVGSQWKHGGDDASLARSIHDGYVEAGMPKFSTTVNDAEIMALVAYIHETAVHRVDQAPKEERALPEGVQHSEEHAYRIEKVAEGFDVPWSMCFLPDGRILVTERAGRLRVVDHGKLRPEVIGGLPPMVVQDEGGLMSVVAHPDFARNGWIYLSYSDPGPNDTAMTRIIRARLRGWQLVDLEPIFSIPQERYQKGYVLFGCRMVFAGDELFFSVGARGMEESVTRDPQELSLPNGKIHRVLADGKIPSDNPFVGQAGAMGSIWAYGVRNPQGLARDPRDGMLWESEHGPRGGDELNHIERGKNYGWPLVTHGMNYDGTPVSDKTDAPGLEPPVLHWTPSIAPSELEFYTGDKFPKWKNQLFLGSLATQKFLRFVVDDRRVTHTEEIFHGLGRVRDIKTGPDGFLYVALELIGKPGRIVRLVPAE